jgi:hypothetical protein
MIAERPRPTTMTSEEYFVWKEQQELRYEYIDGEVLNSYEPGDEIQFVTINFTVPVKQIYEEIIFALSCFQLLPQLSFWRYSIRPFIRSINYLFPRFRIDF